MRLCVIPIPSTRPDGMLYSTDHLRQVIEFAHLADAMGFDDLSTSEHVIMANKPETYPFGQYPHRIDEPFPEPLIMLGAMAGVTQRIRLISGIVIAPLRPAVLVAKSAATLHAISGGRFVMGVSTSWQREEYDALGVPFDERGSRLNDIVGACRALWSGAPASFSSPSVSFQDLYCLPRPAHPDDLPIWFGGSLTPRLIKRIGQFGHGWMPFVGLEPKPLEKIAEGVPAIQSAMREAGRDASKLEVSALLLPRGRDLPTSLEQDVPRFKAAGVTQLRIQVSSFASSREAVPSLLEELQRRFAAYR
jgi:probable F420-dependent oxidoreductase